MHLFNRSEQCIWLEYAPVGFSWRIGVKTLTKLINWREFRTLYTPLVLHTLKQITVQLYPTNNRQ